MPISRLIVTAIVLGCSLVGPLPASARGLTAPTPRAIEHNNRGAKLLNEGQLEQAELELKTAIELSPEYAEAYNNLGIVYKQRNDLDRALQHFQKAAGLNPDYASAYNHIASVHIARGEYDQAIQAADRAIKKERTFADAIFNKGLAWFLKGQRETQEGARRSAYGQAEKQFSLATQLNPKLTIAHKNMGDLYTELGNYEQAAIRYRLALEDDPRAVETWRQLANVYRLMGDTARANNATAKANEVAQLNKGNEAYQAGIKAMASAEQRLGTGDKKGATPLFNQAIKQFAKALLANPASADAAYQLGLAYQRQGVSDMARKAWLQTLAIVADHIGALYNLGTLETVQGNTAEATRYLCRFLAVGGRQFPAEADAVRRQLREQGTTCRN